MEMPERHAIESRLTQVFRDVFDDDGIILTNTTTAKDVKAWDSLSHIHLVLAVEKEFKVRLDLAEIMKLENVGQMIDLLAKRAAG
jgi:acyl carrier protein